MRLDGFWELYEYSIRRREEFWDDVLMEGRLVFEGVWERVGLMVLFGVGRREGRSGVEDCL